MSLITAAQIEQFREEGYFILDSAIPQHHIDLLRGECQAFIDKADARMGASVGGKGKLSERPARLDRQQAGDARMQRGRGDSYLDSNPKL